jgi:hypothetical protein
MRRPLLTALAVAGLVAAAMLPLAACSGDAARTPTVASVDFTPKAELHVPDSGDLTFIFGSPQSDLPSGSVLVVVNDGQDDHRIVGTVDTTQVFDTGLMHPGDSTTVVITKDGDLTVRDVPTGRDGHLTVTPRPST